MIEDCIQKAKQPVSRKTEKEHQIVNFDFDQVFIVHAK
jgi:hypothetical protein